MITRILTVLANVYISPLSQCHVSRKKYSKNNHKQSTVTEPHDAEAGVLSYLL